MANTERLYAVLDHIKALPNAAELDLDNNYAVPMWDQRKWISLPLLDSAGQPMIDGSCGTAGCFAGWAVMLFAPPFELRVSQWDNMVHFVTIDDESRHIETVARELLDLNQFEAEALFESANDLPTIEQIITKIIAGTLDPERDDDDDSDY